MCRYQPRDRHFAPRARTPVFAAPASAFFFDADVNFIFAS